jgi:hypothetical protein
MGSDVYSIVSDKNRPQRGSDIPYKDNSAFIISDPRWGRNIYFATFSINI